MSDTFLNPIDIAELGATPPTPPSGYQRIYAKADGKIYARNASGEEVILNNVDINLSGNTQGNTTFANNSTPITLVGGNNVSLSGTNKSIVINVPSQSADTGKAGTGFTSAGNNIGLSGTLGTNGLSLSATVPSQTQFVLSNSNGVSFGTNGSTVTATVRTDYASSNHTHGAVAYSGTNVSASFTSASNGLSIQLSGNPAQTVDTNKAGTNFAGTNVTATLNSNGLSLSVANPSGGGVGIADTAGTVTNGTVLFSNSNNVTFGLNTALSRITASFSQSVDTGKAGTGISSSSVAGVNVVGTLNTNGLSLGVPNYITTAAQTDHTHGAVAFSGTNVSASFTSASNGLSIQLSAPAGGTGGGAGGVAIAGGTNTRTSGTVNFSNSNGVSFGLNTDGVMTAAGGGAIAAGSQLATQGTVSFVNSNGVSFGMSGSSQITAQIAPHTYTLIGNTVGNSTVSGVNFVLSGGNNITLSGTSNTIVISAGAGGGGAAPNRFYVEINQGERLTTVRNMSETIFSHRPFFFPFWVDGTGVAVNTVRMFVSGVASSNRSLGLTLNAGLYSLVNATQISLLTSGQLSYSITASSQSSQWNGPAIMDFTGMNGFTMSQEGRYMLALQVRPVSANTAWANMAIYGCDNYPSFSRFLSGNTTGATANTLQLLPWQGAYSTTSVGLPSTVARTQIHGGNSASAYQPYAVIMGI